MGVVIQEMTIDDYDEVRALWRESEGLKVDESDSRSSIANFLLRNPGLSFVARDKDKLVGTILCGHDGRRGYLDQLAVHKSHRRQGIGRALVGRCIYQLIRLGIHKWHLFVLEDNEAAVSFWQKLGWAQRVELVIMSGQAES